MSFNCCSHPPRLLQLLHLCNFDGFLVGSFFFMSLLDLCRKVWDYKAGAGRIGICFGGSSIIKLNEDCDQGGKVGSSINRLNEDCDQGGKVWEKTISMTLPEASELLRF